MNKDPKCPFYDDVFQATKCDCSGYGRICIADCPDMPCLQINTEHDVNETAASA
jgi:hypothetical protein